MLDLSETKKYYTCFLLLHICTFYVKKQLLPNDAFVNFIILCKYSLCFLLRWISVKSCVLTAVWATSLSTSFISFPLSWRSWRPSSRYWDRVPRKWRPGARNWSWAGWSRRGSFTCMCRGDWKPESKTSEKSWKKIGEKQQSRSERSLKQSVRVRRKRWKRNIKKCAMRERNSLKRSWESWGWRSWESKETIWRRELKREKKFWVINFKRPEKFRGPEKKPSTAWREVSFLGICIS